MLRVVAACVLLGLAAAGGAAGFVTCHSRDRSPPFDADLAGAAEPVPEPENAYGPLLEAAAHIDVPDGEWPEIHEMIRGERPWDVRRVDALLARNRRALVLVPEMLARRAFRRPAPDYPDGPEEQLESRGWIWVTSLLRLRALQRARRGDTDAALGDALALLRLGRLAAADSNADVIRMNERVLFSQLGLRAIEEMLPGLSVDGTQSRALSATLLALEPGPSIWRSMWAAEYRRDLAFLEYLERLPDDPQHAPSLAEAGSLRTWALQHAVAALPPGYRFQPRATATLFARTYRAARARAALPCARAWPERDPGLRDELGAWDLPERELLPNAEGRRIVSYTAAYLHRWDALRCKAKLRVEATRALVALRAYQLEHGALPASLDALVPRYLTEPPRDPFDGALLRYDPARRRLWSVGSDGLDARGEGREAEGRYDAWAREPVFAIPF